MSLLFVEAYRNVSDLKQTQTFKKARCSKV